MPTYELTIDGVVKDWQHGSLQVALVGNGRDVWGCDLFSEGRVYVPEAGVTASLTENGGYLIEGFLDAYDEQGPGGEHVEDALYRLTFVSQDVLASRRIILSKTFAAGTSLKAIVDSLVTDYLSVYGVTSDPTIPTTPVLTEELVIKNANLADVLDTLSSWSGGLLWTIKNMVLSFVTPALASSPFNISDSDSPRNTIGEIKRRTSRKTNKNTIIVIGGTANVISVQQDQFVGDGVTSTFTLSYPIQGPIYPGTVEIWPGFWAAQGFVGFGVVEYGTFPILTSRESLGFAASTADWVYDPNTLTVTRLAGPVANGEPFWIPYHRESLTRVTAVDAADVALRGPDEIVFEFPGIILQAELQRIADAKLAELSGDLDEVVYKTYNAGMRVGMLQSIECSDRGINGDYLIVEVRARSYEGYVEWTVRGIGGDRFKGSFRDLYAAWLRMGRGGGSSATSPVIPQPQGGGGLGPAPPEGAIQYYKGAVFMGNIAWRYLENEILAKLYGADAEIYLRGQLGGINFGVPALPAALAVRLGSTSSTRLYLSNTAAGYSPATFRGAWDDTTQQITKKLATTKVDTTVLHATASETSTNNEWDLLNYRGVSDALVGQTISGTLSGVIVAMAGVFANHAMYWHVHLYATQGDTDTVRHTFVSDYRENTPSPDFPVPAEWGGFTLSPISMTSGTIQTGDRLVLEVGVVARNTLSGSLQSKIGYGARADRADASPNSAIDTSSWIDINLAAGSGTQVAQAWSNTVPGDDDALTLEILDDGTAHFKNVAGIYLNGLLFSGGAGSGTFTMLTADPASPANDSFWLVRSGTSPNMIVSLKFRIAGVTYTMVAFGPI